MMQIIYDIWNGFSEIPGFLRAIVLSCLILVIFILLIRLLWKFAFKFYGYLIVPLLSKLLYTLIMKNKTEKLKKIDDWYYRKLDRLGNIITKKEFYSGKLYKIICNVSCIVIALFILCILYDQNVSLNNDTFDLPHKVAMLYIGIEEEIAEKLNLAVPVWKVNNDESNDIDLDLNKGIDENYADIEDERNIIGETLSENKYFKLNKNGYLGANIRNKPATTEKVLSVVSGDVLLENMGETETDLDGRVWYLIKAPDDTVGWISSSLVEESVSK